MSLIDDAQQDFADFSSDEDGFGISMLLKSPDGQEITIAGFHTKHHQKYDNNTGMVVNSMIASVAISELNIRTLDAGYPFRNPDATSEHYQKVYLREHLVDIKDSSGDVKNYIVLENFADETLGCIILILGNYRS